ncbi:MAG TPA: hypothetical protein VFU02_10805 [Polyangiaceae bacterium]|nr:hypothetical protein [Polyangiaceae bacterium]
MKLRSGWMLLVAALPFVSLETSCGQTSPQEISDAGTLRLRLTGQSEAGHTYRLRDAELEITGTSSVTLHSEDDPDAESLRHDLPAGAYEILLEDGWFLERQDEDGTFVSVEALLMSANPAPFEIVAQETTNVQLRFQAGDEIVDLGDGTLEVSIAVEEDECAPGQWQQIATLPTTPVKPMIVDGIQRIDADPDTLLVATLNDGACNEGTPAAIWRIDVDHDTGQATDVSFQLSLDLSQSTHGGLFESSDGTLLTGGGWCGRPMPPYYSTDHGDSFQPAIEGDYPPDATYVYVEFQGQVYAGTGSKLGSVYRYNGGGSWTLVFSVPPPHNMVEAMAVHQGRLFVGAASAEGSTACFEGASPVYVSSDGVSFTPTHWSPCGGSIRALASTGDRLLALDAGRTGTVFEWDSATERFSKLAEHPFEAWYIAQNRFVASGGAFYAAAYLKESLDSGIYRSEDGISWAPVVELELTRLDVLNLEGDTLYAAATHPPDTQIYSLDLCE